MAAVTLSTNRTDERRDEPVRREPLLLFPPADVISDVATHAPSDSFQMLRKLLFTIDPLTRVLTRPRKNLARHEPADEIYRSPLRFSEMNRQQCHRPDFFAIHSI
jgi:hypothetical protein